MFLRRLERKFIIKVLIVTAIFMVSLLLLMSEYGVWNVLEFSKATFEVSIFFVLLVSFVITFYLARDIMNPIRDITHVAGKMAEGDLDQKININSRDEIGLLAQSLNTMSLRLKENIEEITEEKNKIKAILSSMDEGVIAIDTNGNVILINPVVETLFNTDNEQALGKNLIEIIRNYELDLLIKWVLEKKEPLNYELSFLVPELRLFRIYLTPLKKNKHSAGVVAILRDITELRNLEQIRTQFVANVSHELRTPLTSIKGFVETLLDGAIEDKETASNFLRIINDETERLSRLINDILSLSKIESKFTQIDKELIRPKEIIDNVVAMLRPLADNKRIGLFVEISGMLPEILADKDMIGQVLINLTENALKYTPEGGQVEISAWRHNNGIKVQVKDSGIGIPPESIPRIFERFYRVDKARSREMGGTGLGLAIVKHIIESHQGTINVESQPNKGSIFSFTLPAE